MASDLLVAIVLVSSLLAAGVNPAASTLFGVQVGGAIDPLDDLLTGKGVREIPGVRPPNNSAFARRLFDASLDSLCDMRSRADGARKWNGVLGGGIDVSSEDEIIRGVPSSFPHVISSFTPAGPSSEGVGEGSTGTSGNPPVFGDLG